MTISRTDTTNVQADGPDERPAAAKPAGPGPAGAASKASGAVTSREWPLWEVFVRPKAGLDHKHCGSLHAADAKLALQLAREVYTRRQEGVSIWVVRSDQVVASDPADKAMLFDPMEDKVYRHPTFYELPPEVGHM